MRSTSAWPDLPLASWRETCDTVHMYTQVVGKVRAALSYPEPEWAHVSLQVTPRGLSTGVIPYGERTFQIDFDFNAHVVNIFDSEDASRQIDLGDRSVADFYGDVMEALRSLEIQVKIRPIPDEVSERIPFDRDTKHKTYDRERVQRFWQILIQVDSALKEHRAPFRRRHTLVQFFWGTFDLAYARFSGRPATPPSNDPIMREAMDAEEICVGFWAGDDRYAQPAFWAYAYPRPDGVAEAEIGPAEARWNEEMGLFILPYEAVRTADSPRDLLRQFFSSTYDVCAKLARWDEVS